MQESRQTSEKGVPNKSNGNIEEAMQQLKINDHQDAGGVAQSNPYPDRPGESDCIYYLRTGLCGYGNNCRFNHPAFLSQGAQYSGELPERAGQPDCGEEKSCVYYMQTGSCKFGPACSTWDYPSRYWIYFFLNIRPSDASFYKSTLFWWTIYMVIVKSTKCIWFTYTGSPVLHALHSLCISRHCICTGLEYMWET